MDPNSAFHYAFELPLLTNSSRCTVATCLPAQFIGPFPPFRKTGGGVSPWTMLRMGRTRSERASGRRGRERIATDAPRIARRSKHRNILSMRCYGSAPVLSGTSVIIMLIGPSGKRSEEHTSELQSLMRISYAVFCLKKKNRITTNKHKD